MFKTDHDNNNDDRCNDIDSDGSCDNSDNDSEDKNDHNNSDEDDDEDNDDDDDDGCFQPSERKWFRSSLRPSFHFAVVCR